MPPGSARLWFFLSPLWGWQCCRSGLSHHPGSWSWEELGAHWWAGRLSVREPLRFWGCVLQKHPPACPDWYLHQRSSIPWAVSLSSVFTGWNGSFVQKYKDGPCGPQVFPLCFSGCDGQPNQLWFGNGSPLRCSCLENPMDGGAWWAAVHGVVKSQTWLSDFTFTFHFHALEKEMAAHSSVLAWRIPGTGSLVGCRLWGCRVGYDWSDLAAAANTFI